MEHLLIIPSWYSSRHRPIVGIFFKEQAEILSKKIDKVGVVSPLFRSFKDFDVSGNQNQFMNVNGVITYTQEIWHYPLLEKLNNKRWFTTCKHLFEKYINDNGLPDIIHVHSITIARDIIKYINKKYNIPFVITEHSTGFAMNGYNKKDLKIFKSNIDYCAYNIAVSESLAQTLSQKLGSTWNVIPNTIQNVFFEEGNKRLSFPRDKQKKIFFTLSNLIPVKGLDILIKAFSMLYKENTNVELWIGGDGSEKKNIEHQIKELKMEDRVFLLGKLDRENVLENLKKADFYISPSLQETFGVVIIEALAMGLPTVATRCGGPEHIINDEVGIIVEKGSADELYSAMKLILANENNYDSKKIIDYCRDNYSEDVVSEKIINVYREVLNG
ncbi:glycosyltransferase [Chryseobacterium sp. PET-29]|uniref:glycosyltransferase n=1 Tax=Chryseobacterium sp. PET-29 TaxID=2983267 RepID=UPI0021E54864|nr:glycosyltransferase [Chryseobacterium sp. PET-29]